MKLLLILGLIYVAAMALQSAHGETLPVHAAPTKTQCASQDAALAAARLCALETGGSLVLTSGTPSMEPLIHGRTYVVVQKMPYTAIAKSDILLYEGRPDASKPERKAMLHRAVMHDRYGWLMSGDNNRWTESWDRVTPSTYEGVVSAIFGFSQS